MRDSRPAFFPKLATWEFASPGPADQQLSLCQGPQVTSGGVPGDRCGGDIAQSEQLRNSKSCGRHRETSLFPDPRRQPYVRNSGVSCVETSNVQRVVHRLVLVCKLLLVHKQGRSLY